jgi:hypothetical protein
MNHHDPYLSAEALGIQTWERDAAIAILPPLACGFDGFNMRVWNDCYCALISGVAGRPMRDLSVGLSAPFTRLCWPNSLHAQTAPAEVAAFALANFLITGEADWASVVGEPFADFADEPGHLFMLRLHFLDRVAPLDAPEPAWLRAALAARLLGVPAAAVPPRPIQALRAAPPQDAPRASFATSWWSLVRGVRRGGGAAKADVVAGRQPELVT